MRVNKDAKGFLANRLQLAVLREALHIVESGIGSPEDVDACMKYGLGLRYAGFGPFEVCDFGGLDTFYHISEYLFPDLSDAKEPFGLLQDRFERGEYGVKTQRGFYVYEDGKAEKTEIEAGIYDDENMEVKSGLTSDSQVIVSWSNELVDQGEVLLAQDSDGAQTNGNNETAAETTEAGDKE